MTRRLISALAPALLARFDAQAEGDVLEHRHVAEQRVVLEDEADVALAGMQVGGLGAGEQDVALIGRFHAGDDAQQRRLAAAGGTEQATSSPVGMSRLMLSSATKLPKRLEMLRISILMGRPLTSPPRREGAKKTQRSNRFSALCASALAMDSFIHHCFPAMRAFSMSDFFMRHSTMVLATSVTSASRASTEAAAKAPMALYSL